jgi:hypothetical protein
MAKHQGDVGGITPSITQIIVNSAKFTTALNATKVAHSSSNLVQ